MEIKLEIELLNKINVNILECLCYFSFYIKFKIEMN